jgi:hypothetical protein
MLFLSADIFQRLPRNFSQNAGKPLPKLMHLLLEARGSSCVGLP